MLLMRDFSEKTECRAAVVHSKSPGAGVFQCSSLVPNRCRDVVVGGKQTDPGVKSSRGRKQAGV